MVQAKNSVVKFKYLRGPKGICGIARKVLGKINREVKIFNKLKAIMSYSRGYAVEYLDCYKRIMQRPNHVFLGHDGITKLFYVYACAKLFLKSDNELVKKQMLKNCLYVFGAKTTIKKQDKVKLLTTKFYSHKQVAFKYLGSEISHGQNFELRGQELSKRNSASYVTYYNNGVSVKYYVAKKLPVKYYEISHQPDVCASRGAGLPADRFSYTIGSDKMKYDLTHTADTFYANSTSKDGIIAMFVNGKVSFGSSLAEKCDELRIYAELQGFAKIFIVHAKSKSDAVGIISRIKKNGYKVDYLFDEREQKIAREVEQIYKTAFESKYICGENLRDKYVATCRVIPTLHLPTLVYTMQNVQDFFDVMDRATLFERIAHAGRNLNLVCLYSSGNDEIREIINAFIDKREMRNLIGAGVFVFFVDKIKQSNLVVNLLSMMAENQIIRNKIKKNKHIEVTHHIGKNFPVTHSFFVRNASGRARNAKVDTCIDLGTPSVVWKNGATLHAVGLKNYSKPYSYKIPMGGMVDIKNQMICDNFVVNFDVKLAPYEEKVFKIIKNDGVLSRAEKKQAFIGNIEDLNVSSMDSRFAELFDGEITDTQIDNKKFALIKRAVSNHDRDLFFLLLKNVHMNIDLWTFFIEKVLGIKLVKGKIQLMPCIQITGDFELRFSYRGTPYKFLVKQNNSGFTINYLEKEFKNFAQLDIDVV